MIITQFWKTPMRALSSCIKHMVVLGWVLVAAAANAEIDVELFYLLRDIEPPLPLSLIDKRVDKDGVAGAQLGLNDNQTTGSFLGHNYEFVEVLISEQGDVVDSVQSARKDPPEIIVANLDANDLLALTEAYPDALILNVYARDDRLRQQDCRSNLLHLPPSRAMLADSLAQYLSWKRWSKVVVVTGRHPEDSLYADALERSIKPVSYTHLTLPTILRV